MSRTDAILKRLSVLHPKLVDLSLDELGKGRIERLHAVHPSAHHRLDVIQQIMCRRSIDIASIERRHDIDFNRYFADALARLQPLVEDGLVLLERMRVSVSSRGRLLLRIIAMCFDRYTHERRNWPPSARRDCR